MSAPSRLKGIVSEVHPGLCRVLLESGETLLCAYRRASLARSFGVDERDFRERAPVAVGDRVMLDRNTPQEGAIFAAEPRERVLQRLAPGREGGRVYHVVASHVDRLVIVTSTRSPDFTSGIVDRFLVAAQVSRIPAILVITKTDLLGANDPRPWIFYRDLKLAEVFEYSNVSRQGLDDLQAKLNVPGLSVFAGHSGVGKTSLLRSLLGTDLGKVGAVNISTGKGQHTTSSAHLYVSKPGVHLVDTPGVREFGVLGCTPEELDQYFPEFRDLPCTARACGHYSESTCDAKALPRHESYVRILEQLLELRDSQARSSKKGKRG